MTDPLVDIAPRPELRTPVYGAPPHEPLQLRDVPEGPATAAQAAEIIRLLTDMNALLRAAFGRAGR